ncbi:MAG: cell division protein ZapB [Geobacteraceae bacterium]
METELFDALEKRIESLLVAYQALQSDNLRMTEENHRLREERDGVKSRIDAILRKLEGI